MAGIQLGRSWFRSPKSKTKPQKDKSSPQRGRTTSRDVTKNGPPSRSILCRAAMTLPPTPRDLAEEDTRLAWGRSCIDSPPHVYEEIPDARDVRLGHDITSCPRRLHEDNHEYLKPTVGGFQRLGITLDDILKRQTHGFSSNVDLCKYDKISPLSALGLTTASLKKCSRCQRPHGVYNGTVYRHGGSNSSPDLVSLDWHSSYSSAYQTNLTEYGGEGACNIPRFHSTNDLCSQDYDRPYEYRCEAPREPVTDKDKSLTTAFQVLKPSRHRQLTDLVSKQNLAKATRSADDGLRMTKTAKGCEVSLHTRHQQGLHSELNREHLQSFPLPKPPTDPDDDDYEYQLSKVRQIFELGMGVQGITKKNQHTHHTPQPGSQHGRPYEQPIRSPDRSQQAWLSTSQPLSQNRKAGYPMSTSLMNLDSTYSTYTPLTRPNGQFHTLATPPKHKRQFKPNQTSSPVSRPIDKLSCRATDFKLRRQSVGTYGSQLLLREGAIQERSVYGSHGNVQRTNHNPLLSDIMRRNHDRQNLVL